MNLENLNKLRFEYQIVFAALTCEKMVPIIAEYDRYENAKGFSLFEEALEMLYSVALGLGFNPDVCSELIVAIESFSPDLDESENEIASYALDTCISFTESLYFISDKKIEHIHNCSTAATDTVDMFVQMASEMDLPPMPELEIFISDNIFMKREIERQKLIADELIKLKYLNGESIAYLRKINGKALIVDLQLL